MEKISFNLEKLHLERWVWCLATAALCWTDVSDYYHLVYNKKLLVWIFLGAFYVVKLGSRKGNRALSLGLAAIGAFFAWFLLEVNYFSHFIYYNYTIGGLVTVFLPLYGIIIRESVRRKKLPPLSAVSILFLLMMLYTVFSPNTEKVGYLAMFFILLPFAYLGFRRTERKEVFYGIVDGICLGFLICQGYTFMYRPYVLTENGSRFKSYTGYCTTAGMEYLLFYCGYMLKGAIARVENKSLWLRFFYFLMSAFIVSLMYLTGGRSPVMAVAVITVMIFGFSSPEKGIKKVVSFCIFQSVLMATLSLLFFPAAYAGTRYLPTVLNNPDLQDSEGNRSHSFATVTLKQAFLKNGEWNYWSVRAGDPADSILYVTLEECFGDTLCRIVPGLSRIAYPVIGPKILEDKLQRAQYLHDIGEISDLGLCELVSIYCETYNQPVPAAYEGLMEKYGDMLELLRQEQPVNASEACEMFQPAVLRVYAAGMPENSRETVAGRGDSPETGWFAEGESYNALDLRIAIHRYALSKLNLTGHPRNSFLMYEAQGQDLTVGNSHNIFLNVGYDYGIPAMLLMAAVFVLLPVQSVRLTIKKGNITFLIPAVLVIGMTLLGWFEAFFGCYNAMSVLIFQIAMLWDGEETLL